MAPGRVILAPDMAVERARTALERVAPAKRLGVASADALDSSRFLRGLAIGALVGAAIAGSTVWQRRRVRDRLKRELGGDSEAPAG